jgi:hypothetical protein
MPRPARRFRAEALGRHTRDLVLRCYIASNPYHDRPGWEEITDHSRDTWTRVAKALMAAGWLPPPEFRA